MRYNLTCADDLDDVPADQLEAVVYAHVCRHFALEVLHESIDAGLFTRRRNKIISLDQVDFFTVSDVAKILSISDRTARRLAADPKNPLGKIKLPSGAIRFDPAIVKALLKNRPQAMAAIQGHRRCKRPTIPEGPIHLDWTKFK